MTVDYLIEIVSEVVRRLSKKSSESLSASGRVNNYQTQKAEVGLVPIEIRAGVSHDTTMGPQNSREDTAVVGALVACPVYKDISKERVK